MKSRSSTTNTIIFSMPITETSTGNLLYLAMIASTTVPPTLCYIYLACVTSGILWSGTAENCVRVYPCCTTSIIVTCS
ncbi:hypothetical protein BDQ94DRAFT_136619 [Aspergillus welwitschiae]|uniref:Uncharacterized protein n=1 Tax=Aspergillus welwitschiae TaxID=1341132 RepID=A0A3F3QEA0_9EURO|nr:hypothetical protein BDQ94DRAFT_136619 [Aspergillus welwitschiae]RDH37553.1 hypothetical protein BDQ94DRAFT_136619 [Aspergillus welwitschiae]